MANKKVALEGELEELRSQITSIEREMAEPPDYSMGEASPGVARREVDRALLTQLQERAATIERALSVKDGTEYGHCVECGLAIHPDRLAALPGVNLCARCALSKDSGGQQGTTHLVNQ